MHTANSIPHPEFGRPPNTQPVDNHGRACSEQTLISASTDHKQQSWRRNLEMLSPSLINRKKVLKQSEYEKGPSAGTDIFFYPQPTKKFTESDLKRLSCDMLKFS